MANIKPMVEHIARGIAGDHDWDSMTSPHKAACLTQATRLLAGAPVLYDALHDEQLRELLSYCKLESETYGRQYDDDRAAAYDDVAGKLTAILDGEQ